MKPVAYMLVGVPGSGKSTWAAQLLEDQKTALVSSDAYIERMAEAVGKTYGEVFQDYIKEATAHMKAIRDAAISNLQNIVWDQTNLTLKSRQSKLDVLREAGYDVVAVTFEIPDAELKRRREERAKVTGKDILPSIVEEMGRNYVRPTRLEGFSKVIVVTPAEEYEADE